MKIAVLLKGIFYMSHYSRKSRLIDYRKSVASFHAFFKNHEVDYYISTYANELQQNILNEYKPVAYEFRPYKDTQVFYANNISIIKVLELFLNNKKCDYDFIIVTRPDITFEPNIKFENLNLRPNHDVLMIMRLHKHRRGFFEDNFNIVGMKVIPDYIRVIRNNIAKSHHRLLRRFEERVQKVIAFNFHNFRVTPGSTGFYKLIKLHVPVPAAAPLAVPAVQAAAAAAVAAAAAAASRTAKS